MISIVLRSIIIGLIITVISFLFTEIVTEIDEDLITYCKEGVEEDPECKKILESDEKEIDELIILVDFFYFLTEFFLVFFGALLFGLWQHFKPIERHKQTG